MRGFLLRWFLNAFALWITSSVLSGIQVTGVKPLLIAALVLGVLNAILRPILLILTIPFLLLSLGLFVFVLNGFLLLLTSSLVSGFYVAGFWSAFFGALLLSFVSYVLNLFLSDRGRIEYVYVERRSRHR